MRNFRFFEFSTTKKQVLFLMITLSLIILTVLFMYFEEPRVVISRKTGLALSKEDNIINYERIYFDDLSIDRVYAKVEINELEEDSIKNQLEYEEILPRFNGNSNDYRFISNLYDWFCIDEDEIVYSFVSYRTDHRFIDKGFHNIFILITHEENYYLYIAVE